MKYYLCTAKKDIGDIKINGIFLCNNPFFMKERADIIVIEDEFDELPQGLSYPFLPKKYSEEEIEDWVKKMVPIEEYLEPVEEKKKEDGSEDFIKLSDGSTAHAWTASSTTINIGTDIIVDGTVTVTSPKLCTFCGADYDHYDYEHYEEGYQGTMTRMGEPIIDKDKVATESTEDEVVEKEDIQNLVKDVVEVVAEIITQDPLDAIKESVDVVKDVIDIAEKLPNTIEKIADEIVEKIKDAAFDGERLLKSVTEKLKREE